MSLFRRKTVADILGDITTTITKLDDHSSAATNSYKYHAGEAEFHSAQATQAAKVANRLRDLVM